MTFREWYDLYGMEIRDIVERAVKTGIQTAAAAGFLGYAVGGDWAGVKTVALASVASAVSVLWNAVVAYSAS